MPRSDRGEGIAALAVAIAVTLGVALLFALVRPPLPPTNYESGYHNHAAKCADADGMYRRFLDARVTDAYPSDYEEEDAKHKGEVAHWCDLAAQELTALAGAESAYFTRLGAIATVAAALFLIIALLQTRAMLREAKDTAAQARLATDAANRTTDVTREIGEASERATLRIANFARDQVAYLADDDGESTRKFSPAVPGDTIRVEIGHFGKSSAYNVVINARLSFNSKNRIEEEQCAVNPRTIVEVSKNTDFEISFNSDYIKLLQREGLCKMPVSLLFEIEIMYEDIFTIGTQRDVNITRQRFHGGSHWIETESRGRMEVGKEDRTRYELCCREALLG